MDNSDSGSDAFESAEEYVSAGEEETCHKETTADTEVKRQESITESDDDNHQVDVSNYRKRPVRSRRSATPNQSIRNKIPELKQVIDIAKVPRPDHIIKSVTSQLTSNITKGFSAIQEKSTSIKQLVTTSLIDETKSDDGIQFLYDEVRLPPHQEEICTEIKSQLNEEILKLSEAFERLNEANSVKKSDDTETTDTDVSVANDPTEVMSEPMPTQEQNAHSCENEVESPRDSNLSEALVPSIVANSGTVNKEVLELKPEKRGKIVIASENSNVEFGACMKSHNYEETPLSDDANFATIKTGYGEELATTIEKEENFNTLKDAENENASDNEMKPISDEVESSKLSTNVSNIIYDSNLMEKTQPEQFLVSTISDSEGLDGWDEWPDDVDIGDTPTSSFVVEEEVEKPTTLLPTETFPLRNQSQEGGTSLEANDSEDGWGDWGEIDSENEKKLIEMESEAPLQVKRPERNEKSSALRDKSHEQDLHSWNDWGDESESYLDQTKDKSVDSNEKKTADDWKGWETFGQKNEKEWGGISSWGFNTLLNTATAVTSNLSAVTQGISNAIETGLGVPDPETMARIKKEEESMTRLNQPKEENMSRDTEVQRPSQFPFRHIVAGVGKIVEVAKVQEIGSRVLSGGLDTLETIGKKTMEVLQEGDPGLKNKKALILGKGLALSQVLREARDRASLEEKRLGNTASRRRCDFELLFDDYQGLVHLEALEMLSRQCELRVEKIVSGLPTDKAKELRDTMSEVELLCEVDEDFEPADADSFGKAIMEAIEPLEKELSVTKIVQIHEDISSWLSALNSENHTSQEMYEKAISAMAELTAAATQQFHKAGELLILKERRRTVEEADCFLQFSSHICSEISTLSQKIAGLLRQKDQVETLVNNLIVEATNATAYVKQAFSLLVPVLQLGATRNIR